MVWIYEDLSEILLLNYTNRIELLGTGQLMRDEYFYLILNSEKFAYNVLMDVATDLAVMTGVQELKENERI